jgi:carboxymethylenebutenolidase
VVLGVEAMGPNAFSAQVAHRLAERGHTVVVPDYLRGTGPEDPDDYEHLAPVRRAIAELNFVDAALDVLDAVATARTLSGVDPERVAVWGYCTGGTLALLAACLDRRLGAAVCFYPSQLTFDVLDERRPVNPMDLIWALASPTVVFYGDQDRQLAGRRTELERRLRAARADARLVVYPGADHVFAGPMPRRYRADCDADSWTIATDLLDRVLAPPGEQAGTSKAMGS